MRGAGHALALLLLQQAPWQGQLNPAVHWPLSMNVGGLPVPENKSMPTSITVKHILLVGISTARLKNVLLSVLKAGWAQTMNWFTVRFRLL